MNFDEHAGSLEPIEEIIKRLNLQLSYSDLDERELLFGVIHLTGDKQTVEDVLLAMVEVGYPPRDESRIMDIQDETQRRSRQKEKRQNHEQRMVAEVNQRGIRRFFQQEVTNQFDIEFKTGLDTPQQGHYMTRVHVNFSSSDGSVSIEMGHATGGQDLNTPFLSLKQAFEAGVRRVGQSRIGLAAPTAQ